MKNTFFYIYDTLRGTFTRKWQRDRERETERVVMNRMWWTTTMSFIFFFFAIAEKILISIFYIQNPIDIPLNLLQKISSFNLKSFHLKPNANPQIEYIFYLHAVEKSTQGQFFPSTTTKRHSQWNFTYEFKFSSFFLYTFNRIPNTSIKHRQIFSSSTRSRTNILSCNSILIGRGRQKLPHSNVLPSFAPASVSL